MSANDDSYRDDVPETYDEDDTGSSQTWVPWAGGRGLGWPYRSGSEEDAARREERSDDTDDSWLDEGLIGTLLVVGVILFFFPEPSTSVLGIILVGIGVLAWIADAVAS